jgi:hypothetical protein
MSSTHTPSNIGHCLLYIHDVVLHDKTIAVITRIMVQCSPIQMVPSLKITSYISMDMAESSSRFTPQLGVDDVTFHDPKRTCYTTLGRPIYYHFIFPYSLFHLC